jgi:cellulose synthase/poly-beta-1,6-N-acetylglucosamine synthase-like glycosyltransferase
LIISGTPPLIDRSIDLYYVTLPIFVLALLYVFLSLFIFAVYLLTFEKVKKKQVVAILRSGVTAKRFQDYTNKILVFESGNNNYRGIANNGIRTQNELLSRDMIDEGDLCSVVIAARNEDSVIKRTVIESLKQTHTNTEVIVVCHNCTDSTYTEAQIDDARVHAFDFKTAAAGKGIALNFGVGKAKGKYLLILDADGLLNHEFIEKALPLFDDGYAAVQGRYIASNRDYSLTTKLLAIEGDLWSTPYSTARAFLDKRCGLGGTGYIIRKDILIGVGGFQNHLVDDYELTCRLLKKKYRIGFAPLCINYDEKPPSLEIMLRQRARWAKGFLDLLKHRATEPTDVLGFLFWLAPLSGFCGFVMLILTGFAAIHNLIFEYLPYYYASMPASVWMILTILVYAFQTTSLINQYGRRGLKYAAYLPLYNVFILYFFVTILKGLTVKSWASTKTTHGFIKPSGN